VEVSQRLRQPIFNCDIHYSNILTPFRAAYNRVNTIFRFQVWQEVGGVELSASWQFARKDIFVELTAARLFPLTNFFFELSACSLFATYCKSIFFFQGGPPAVFEDAYRKISRSCANFFKHVSATNA